MRQVATWLGRDQRRHTVPDWPVVAKPWMRWTLVVCAVLGQPVLVAVLWLLGPP